jgi:hypothetical protein
MGQIMFDYLKKKLGTKKKAPAAPRAEKPVPKTEKEIATEKGEPWVSVLGIEVDYENLKSGAFTLDWNDKFVANLVRAGYQGKTDSDIVDLWFQNICRHVVMETWEQEQAILKSFNGQFIKERDAGDGRKEIS